MKHLAESAQPDISIVIPAYCEERRIGQSLDTLQTFLSSDPLFKNLNFEVIVSVSECPDKTGEIVHTKQLSFQQLALHDAGINRGKGYSVRSGMLSSRGRFVIFMDADLATPLHHLKYFYTACANGADIVIGTRNLLNYRRSPLRRITSAAGNVLFRAVSGLWVEDSQCGFKMFTADAARTCFPLLTIFGWGFDMEILSIARINRFKVKTVRIDDWSEEPYSTFTDNIFSVLLHTSFDLLTILKNRLIGAYVFPQTSNTIGEPLSEEVENYP